MRALVAGSAWYLFGQQISGGTAIPAEREKRSVPQSGRYRARGAMKVTLDIFQTPTLYLFTRVGMGAVWGLLTPVDVISLLGNMAVLWRGYTAGVAGGWVALGGSAASCARVRVAGRCCADRPCRTCTGSANCSSVLPLASMNSCSDPARSRASTLALRAVPHSAKASSGMALAASS